MTLQVYVIISIEGINILQDQSSPFHFHHHLIIYNFRDFKQEVVVIISL